LAGKKTREYVRDMQEVKSLEQEVLELEVGLEQGMSKLKGYQKEILSDARKYLDTMKNNKSWSEKNKKEWKETANAVKDSLNFNMSQEDIQKKILKMKVKQKQGVNTGAAQGIAKKQLGTKKQADMMGKMTKGLSSIVSKLGLLVKVGGPLMMFANLVQFIIDLFMGFDKKIQKTYERFGAINTRMTETMLIQNEIDKRMMMIGKRFDDVQKAALEIGKTMAMDYIEVYKWAEKVVEVAKATATSEQNVQKLARSMKLARGATMEMAFDFQRLAFAMALMEDDIAVPGAVLEDMAANSELMYTMTGSTSKELAMSAVNAAKLNTNLSEFEKIGRKMMNVQQTIRSEMELQSVGINVQNSLEIGRLFNQGRSLDAMKSMLETIRGITNLEELSVSNQDMLGEHFGVSYATLVDIKAANSDIVDLQDLSEEQMKRLEAQAKKIQGVKAQSPMQQMLNILKAQLIPMIEEALIPAFEKILNIIQKIADFFYTIGDWLAWLNPFNDSYYQDKALSDKKKKRDDIMNYGSIQEKEDLDKQLHHEQSLLDELSSMAGSDGMMETDAQRKRGWEILNELGIGDAVTSDMWRGGLYTGNWSDMTGNVNDIVSRYYSDGGIETLSQKRSKMLHDIFSDPDRQNMTVDELIGLTYGDDGALSYSESRELKKLGLLGGGDERDKFRELAAELKYGIKEAITEINDENKHTPSSTIGSTTVTREGIQTSGGTYVDIWDLGG
tara:strand:+ start:2015 stop:4201 length:2187 start_codon:yes stop_codon:yes gene_type:complete